MSKGINQLIAQHRQNTEEHSCQVSNEDYLKVEPEIRLLERLSEIENCTYTVFDLHKNIYLLKSSKFKRMLGYNNPNDLESDDFEVFHSMIHPSDLPFVLETENEAHEFYRNLPASEKKEFKLIYDFRVKNAAGIYMRFIHQFIVLKQDISGKSWLALIVTELLSERAGDEKPQRRMINMRTGKLHLFTHDDGFGSGTLLTKRETQVLRLISQGLDSGEISSRLFISVNTVNNHRQKILSKTRTANTTQALLYARRIGII
ncbi:MAG: response regulator transcription factor [Chloroflexota bacterium]